MGNPARKRDEKEGSRGRILDGATEEFAAAGFAGARIDRIARRTKLNVRMIYYHFGSKKGLYRAVLQGIYEQAVRILDETEQLEEPTLPALGMYFDLLAEHPRFASVLVREILDGAKHLKALFKERPDLFKRVHVRARDIVETGIEQGLLKADDTRLTVMSLTSIVCFLTAGREAMPLFLDGRFPDTAEFKAHLFNLLFEGLRKR
jgi:TetR/AcrR family transcriptional regulator